MEFHEIIELINNNLLLGQNKFLIKEITGSGVYQKKVALADRLNRIAVFFIDVKMYTEQFIEYLSSHGIKEEEFGIFYSIYPQICEEIRNKRFVFIIARPTALDYKQLNDYLPDNSIIFLEETHNYDHDVFAEFLTEIKTTIPVVVSHWNQNVIERLLNMGCNIFRFDPMQMHLPLRIGVKTPLPPIILEEEDTEDERSTEEQLLDEIADTLGLRRYTEIDENYDFLKMVKRSIRNKTADSTYYCPECNEFHSGKFIPRNEKWPEFTFDCEKCNKPGAFLVDMHMIDLLKGLWELGFKTKFSCSGHPHDNNIKGYITVLGEVSKVTIIKLMYSKFITEVIPKEGQISIYWALENMEYVNSKFKTLTEGIVNAFFEELVLRKHLIKNEEEEIEN